MADDHTTTRYRKLYARLLRLYPQPYRERFAESMEQTFNDLCRERAEAGEGLGGFVLWVFVETSAGVIRENGRFIMMPNKNIIRIALATAILLLVPLLGNHFIDGWNWDLFDFAFMGALLFGTGLTFELVARKGGTIAYRAAVGIACAAGLLLVWINAAVGIIGDEDLANAMYFGVLAVGFISASIARFQPRGMSRALFATAVAQALVPLIAMIWVPAIDFSPGVVAVLGVNAFFVALWLTSAWLFRKAAPKQPPAVAGLVG
jgi:hypothetical protein